MRCGKLGAGPRLPDDTPNLIFNFILPFHKASKDPGSIVAPSLHAGKTQTHDNNSMTGKLPINIDHLLRQRAIEGERIEYKAGWNPQSVLHTICAFANDFHNLGGGYIVLGVEEQNGRPVLPPTGIDPESVEAIQKELLNLGYSAIQPWCHPSSAIYDVDGRTILVLWVPGGETRPYKAKVNPSAERSDWAYFIRKHSSTVCARGQDERELLSLAATVPFDDRYRQTASLDDLSHRLIREFLGEIGSELAAEAEGLSVQDLGKRLNIVGGPPRRCFPRTSVCCSSMSGRRGFSGHPDRCRVVSRRTGRGSVRGEGVPRAVVHHSR